MTILSETFHLTAALFQGLKIGPCSDIFTLKESHF